MLYKSDCPYCGVTYEVIEQRVGKTEICERCGSSFELSPKTQAGDKSSDHDPVDWSEPKPEMPSSIGRYKVIERLGQGEMGIVYLADDIILRRRVAVKIPRRDFRRFLREAIVGAQFHHANFCPIHDIGQHNNIPYLVMAFIEGKTLSKLIVKGVPWASCKAVELIRTLSLALGKAHAKGVIHRDLKPANIMIDLEDRVFLMDFGLARRIDSDDPTITSPGAIVGTISYMPPEQAQGHGKEVGPHSDQYSLGVILYELLTGRRPFEGPQLGVLYQISNNHPQPPSSLNPSVDAPLEAIVLKAMAKQLGDRYASMEAFAEGLGGWLDANRPTETPKPTVSVRSTRSGPEFPTNLDSSLEDGLEALALKRVGKKSGDQSVSAKPIAKKLLGLFEAFRPPTPPKSIVTPPPPAPVPAVRPPIPQATQASQGPQTNTLGMEMALIPANEFLMGSDETDPDAYSDEKVDGNKHRVRISLPFLLGKTSVTVGQFRQFVYKTGFKTDAERDGRGEPGWGWNEAFKTFTQDPKFNWRTPGFPQTDDHPVTNVTWHDARAFCEWLSQTENQTYRLPTEAEWEYACRGGGSTRYSSGDDPESLAKVGNVPDGTAKEKYPDWTWAINARDGFVFTAPVGRFTPNDFGLYDMHGNVWEWCADYYEAKFYRFSPTTDPLNSTPGTDRVIRGGSWYDYPRFARSSSRYKYTPENRGSFLGFRVLRLHP